MGQNSDDSFRSRKPSREEQACTDYEVSLVGGERAAATEESPSAKHVATIASAAKTVSDWMNFDADRIDIVEVEPRTFEVGGRVMQRGAFYDPATGRIEIDARTNVPDGPDNLVKGLVAHEVTHALQDALDNVRAQEHDAIRELSREEFDRLFMANGFPRKEKIAEIEKRFPASAAMAKGAPTGDSYLGAWSKGTDGQWAFDERAHAEDGGRMEQMANEAGFTVYSKLYWDAWREAEDEMVKAVWKRRAIQETLAEVAAYHERATRGEWKECVPARSWQHFWDEVRAVYPTIESKVVRGETSMTEVK